MLRSVAIAVAVLGVCAGADGQSSAVGVLERRCVSCHGARTKVSGLDLSSRESLLRGGSKGIPVKPGSAAESLLFLRVRDGQMPPTAPLPPEEVETLRQWIDAGAPWVGAIEQRRAGPDWWSLQPLARVTPPDLPADSPIDKWILAKLSEKGLRPSPPADRRTLIRRLSFDLTGLPPTPEQVSEFAGDTRSDAYERLVDRLLASPHYGERWARHWLDVVRYSESEGFERDWMRDNAWHYRDYVIRSFNDDKPYTQFAREQIAGDVFERGVTRDGIIATAFLALGPTDEVGLTSAVAEQRTMVREDQLEEMLGTVGQTFLGLTVNCARCHDHKFDPIPQKEYYALKASLEGVWQGDRALLTPDEANERERLMDPIRKRIAELEARVAEAEKPGRARVLTARGFAAPALVPAPVARWTFDTDTRDSAGDLHLRLPKGAALANGRLKPAGKEPVTLKTAALGRDVREKTLEAWVTVNEKPEKPFALLSIANQSGYRGAALDAIQFGGGKKWENQSTARFRSQEGNGPAEDTAPGGRIHLAFTYAADDTIRLYRNGVPYGEAYRPDITTPAGKLQTYVRGDAEIALSSSPVFELDEARIYDVALTPEQVAASFAAGAPSVSAGEISNVLEEPAREELARLRDELASARQRLESIPEPVKVFGVDSKAPGVTHVLERGDISRKREPIAPAGLSAIRGLAPEFGVAVDGAEAPRRRALAAWITHGANPLFARVMVNRVWHYHFGTGLVANPNDFGYNGGAPSHPELLDWLAAGFASNGWSLKKLHKEIVMSAAYRQSSAFDARAAREDSDNRLLWRFPSRRLEGEAVRDAMLVASGQLNARMGGPSSRPFTTEKKGSLEIYTLIDRADADFDRRTVYRMNVNSAGSPMLEGLDCPLPSVKTPKRATTTTPLQALSLMNGDFVTRQAKAFAARVEREGGSDMARRVSRAFQLALGREPDEREREWSESLVAKSGIEALCWGLFNTSEFVYVD